MPKQGRRVRYKKNNGEWRVGTVDVIWSYDGETIIDVAEGGSFIPAFGDEWEYV